MTVGAETVGAVTVGAVTVGAVTVGAVTVGARRPAAPGLPDVSRGWFPQDAADHVRDAPRFCPSCSAALPLGDGGHGIVVEFWQGSDRVFACYCGECGWSGDIYLSSRVLGHEPDEE